MNSEGTKEDISERLKVHVPIALEARRRTNGEPFQAMDLGCGRGGWLSLLLEERIVARDDCNPSLLSECRVEESLGRRG